VNPATQADPRIRDGLRESLWAFGGARLLLFVISVALLTWFRLFRLKLTTPDCWATASW